LDASPVARRVSIRLPIHLFSGIRVMVSFSCHAGCEAESFGTDVNQERVGQDVTDGEGAQRAQKGDWISDWQSGRKTDIVLVGLGKGLLVSSGTMKPSPPWQDDKQRLEVLWQYAVLDTPPEEAVDSLTALAAQISAAPIALNAIQTFNTQPPNVQRPSDRRRTTTMFARKISQPEP
jgi:hypothetical protein